MAEKFQPKGGISEPSLGISKLGEIASLRYETRVIIFINGEGELLY